MSQREVIAAGGEFAPQAQGADVRRVLKARAVGIKCRVGDGQGIYARFTSWLAHAEGVLTVERLRHKPEVLQDYFTAHFVPEAATATAAGFAGVVATAFLRRLARFRFCGVASAGSNPIRLVTNFFISGILKSIQMRTASGVVITPSPVLKMFNY